MKLCFGVVLVWIAVWSVTLAGAQTPDAVDQLVRAEMEKQHIPGLALLVSRDGRPIRSQGYGMSNLELQVPVKPETIFQSGSVANNSRRPQ